MASASPSTARAAKVRAQVAVEGEPGGTLALLVKTADSIRHTCGSASHSCTRIEPRAR
jgi:hypothetical protein